jgi:hypothetical protein
MLYVEWMKIVKRITSNCYGGSPMGGTCLRDILRHPIMFVCALTYNLKYF